MDMLYAHTLAKNVERIRHLIQIQFRLYPHKIS